jgi:trehalose 2-sulfotransferase
MGPTLSYIICAAHRSGSNYLCDLLRRTHIAGRPNEFFSEWHLSALAKQKNPSLHDDESWESVDKYLNDILEQGSSSNGVFGVKILGTQVDTIRNKLCLLPRIGPSSLTEALSGLFPNLHYLYLIRDDKIAQAVSFARAIQSELWLEFEPWVLESKPLDWTDEHYRHILERREKGAHSALTYRRQQIAWCLKRIEQQETFWESFFRDSGISPLRLIYEQLEQSPETELMRILEYLGLSSLITAVTTTVTLKRQRDSVNEEWGERFRQELSAK